MKAITKTAFIGLCLLGSALAASAQLQLHSNGKLSFKRTANFEPLSPITLGVGDYDEDSTYFMSYIGEGYNGFKVVSDNGPGYYDKCYGGTINCWTNESETAVGLMAYGSNGKHTTSSTPGSVGLWGLANANNARRYGYGVLGSVWGDKNCAAVCGITNLFTLSGCVPDDQYAGLFVGKTKVVGDLTVTNGTIYGVVVNPSATDGDSQLLRLVDNMPVADRLMGLNTLTFHFPQPEPLEEPDPAFLQPDKQTVEMMAKHGIDLTKMEKPEEDVMARQVREKEHYALSVDELEKTFPDLVYTDKDGNKSVNYVEMVPLLVQCINELNARLSALDGGTGAGNVEKDPVTARDDMASARASQGDVSAIGGTTAKTQAVLYQNTPNPFTAQTEIRFSLPEDAPQAYIYIFDMTGKMQKQIPVDPDQQSVTINGSGLAQGLPLQPGIYLYSLVVGGQEIDSKKMILSK